MNDLPRTQRTTLKRLPQRGSFERQQINEILDEGLVCHVGFVWNGQPFVIPTGYARVRDTLIIHGSQASRMLRQLGEGIDVCVTVTLIDRPGIGAFGFSSFDELPVGRHLWPRNRDRKPRRKNERTRGAFRTHDSWSLGRGARAE